MPSTASTTYADYIEGKLLSSITTATTTGVTVKIRQVNGVTPTWPTAAHRIKIVQKTATNNKVEKFGVAAGTSQSGQTVTLGTLTRALSLTDGTNFSGSVGTAQSFAAGADVFITWDNHDAAQTPKLDLVNAYTGASTHSGLEVFTGGINMTGNGKYLQLPSMTTGNRPSPSAGMLMYDSTTGFPMGYAGSAWYNAIAKHEVRSVAITSTSPVGSSSTATNATSTLYTIPADDWAIGAAYRVSAWYLYTLVSGSLTVAAGINGSEAITFGGFVTGATTNGMGFAQFDITSRTVGASATLKGFGWSIGATKGETATGTLSGVSDTTASMALTYRAAFSASNVSHAFSIINLYVEKLNT